MPLVSIILPAFNAENTVGKAISSCLVQSLADLEVIVIDDASHDGTVTAARTAAAGDPRVTVLELPSNGGVSTARNAGIALARGRWLALLDADDYFAPDRLRCLVAAADARSADLLADNLLVTYPAGRLPDGLAFPERRMRQPGPIGVAAFVAADRARKGLAASGFMKPLVRLSFVRSHGLRFADDLHAGEDFHLYVQCLLAGAKLHYVPAASYVYTLSERSLSRADNERVRSAMLVSSGRLQRDASRAGDANALRELRRREADLRSWIEYKRLESAWSEGRYADAFRGFVRMPSKPYAVTRLAGLWRSKLSLRLALGRRSLCARGAAGGRSAREFGT